MCLFFLMIKNNLRFNVVNARNLSINLNLSLALISMLRRAHVFGYFVK